MAASFAMGAAVFLATAVVASGRPLNAGTDRLWALLWIVLVVVVAVSQVLFGPRILRQLWGAGIAALALAMTVFSGQAAAVALAAWMLAVAWGCGEWLLDRIAPARPGDRLSRSVVGAALGLTVLAFLALLLALAQMLTSAASYEVLGILTALLAWPRIRRRAARAEVAPPKKRKRRPAERRGRPLPERGPIFVLLAFLALANFAWALAPEIQYDAMNYQLSVPAVWAAEHRLLDLPVFWHSYFAHLFNMVFALGFSLHGAAIAKLLVFGSGLLAAAGTFALGRSTFGERVGLWAAAAFYATPLVGWLSGTAYVDLPVTLFTVAALLALLQWRGGGEPGWLLAAGALAGAALGTKLTALSTVAAATAVLAFFLWKDRETSLPQRAAAVARFVLPLAAVAAPWFGIVYAFTGNPFFPLFNGVFKSPGWDPVNTHLNAGLFGIGTGPGKLLALPFAMTFRTGKFGEALPDGGLGIALALVPAAAVFGWKALAGRRFLLVSIAAYLIVWGLNVQYARYYIPILPAVCVTAAGAIVSLAATRGARILALALAAVVLAVQVPLYFLQYWNIHERVPLRLAFGKETREAFLSRALGGVWEAVSYLNGIAKPGEKAVTGGADAMRLYLKIPLGSMSETFELKRLCMTGPPAQVARNLAANGYNYLLVDGEIDPRAPDPFSTPEFLRKFTTLEFQHTSGRVYRIHADPNPDAPGQNLLANPGFEALTEHGHPEIWSPNGRPPLASGPDAHSGGAALIADSENFASQPIAVDPGSSYVLREWIREAAPGSSARLQVNWLDSSARTLDSTIRVVPATAQWAAHEMTVTVPAGAAVAVVFASVHSGRVVFDDFSFVPAKEKGP